MIIGIGTDIIEIERVSRAIQSRHFKNRVYAKSEQDYCESRGKQKAASYAVRFAGKEAFFKSLGTGIICNLNEVAIINDELGAPHVKLSGKAAELSSKRNVNKIHISLSHSRDYATAVCILESDSHAAER